MSSIGPRHSSERHEVLRGAPLFTGLDEGLMAHLATLARGVDLPPDGLVYREDRILRILKEVAS
jgi:hypothetical protein